MRMLERSFHVSTRYGGGFVESINGLSGERQPARLVLLRQRGRGARRARPRRSCTRATGSGGISTTGPRPTRSPRSSARSPSRSSTATAAGGCRLGSSARPRSAPRAAGHRRARSRDGVPSRPPGCRWVGNRPLAIVVGTWSDLRADVRRGAARPGPGASGVYARFTGRRHGARAARSGRPRGANARRGRRPDRGDRCRHLGQPTWLVTGTDAAGVRRGGAAFDARALDGHFAVAVVRARRDDPGSGAARRT